jgi:hypothetical protein
VRVYRSIDGQSTARNKAAFAASRLVLSGGGLVALFPEGISHDEPTLQPLRTGAARIALESAFDDGTPGVVTVAVGLTFDAKARFRSRALVRVGPPEPAERWRAAYEAEPHAAVRSLTTELAERLTHLSPSYETWQQGDELRRIAEIVARPLDPAVEAETPLHDIDRIARDLADASARDSARVASVRSAFSAYEQRLALVGVTDAELTTAYGGGRLRREVMRTVLATVVALPLALVGAVIHVVPYEIVKAAAAQPKNDGIRATVKIVGSFALYLITYAVLGVVVGIEVGAWAGAVAAVLAPFAGYVTLRYAERLERAGGLLSGARSMRRRQASLASLLADRAAAVRLAEEVVGVR